jgi:hypothetical protein
MRRLLRISESRRLGGWAKMANEEEVQLAIGLRRIRRREVSPCPVPSDQRPET